MRARPAEAAESGLTHEETLRAFTEFIVEFAHIMLGSDTPRSWGQFIYREQFDPTEAFEILHTKFAPMLELGFEYVSRLTKRPAEAPETRIQFMAILVHDQVHPGRSRLGAAGDGMEVDWRRREPDRGKHAAAQYARAVCPFRLSSGGI